MPGNVATAGTGLTVMPYFLCSAFSESRTYERIQNDFSDGRNHRRVVQSISRKVFEPTAERNAAQMSALRAFFLATKASPFYYYNLTETSPLWTVDASGASTAGRYIVRFDAPMTVSSKLGNWTAGLRLVECA